MKTELTELAQEASEYYKLQIKCNPGGKTSRQGQCRKIRTNYLSTDLCKSYRDRQITGIEELNKMIWVELEELNTRKINQKPSRKEIYEGMNRLMFPFGCNSIDGNQKKQNVQNWVKPSCRTHWRQDLLQCTRIYTGQRSENEIQWKCGWRYTIKGRIALHSRSKVPGKYTTVEGHMPANHRIAKKVLKYTKEDIMRMALQTGANTSELVEKMMERNHMYNKGLKVHWSHSTREKVWKGGIRKCTKSWKI